MTARYLTQQTTLVVSILLMALISVSAADKHNYEKDKDSGLIMAPGWKIVKANCTACHSASYITAQRGDRKTWESLVRWMQQSQGLGQLSETTETAILDYLATNYAPGVPARRANLPRRLLPE